MQIGRRKDHLTRFMRLLTQIPPGFLGHLLVPASDRRSPSRCLMIRTQFIVEYCPRRGHIQ